jgi:pre-60S factor REI1
MLGNHLDTNNLTTAMMSRTVLNDTQSHATTSAVSAPGSEDFSFTPSQDGDSDDRDFAESRCLICDLVGSDIDDNLGHMARSHGLYVDSDSLVVEIGVLLARLHEIISDEKKCHRQRRSRRAVQQHMVSKGHCMYDADNDAELSEMFVCPGHGEDTDGRLGPARMSHTITSQHTGPGRSALFDEESLLSFIEEAEATVEPSYGLVNSGVTSTSNALSIRALKQARRLGKHRSNLRAADQVMLSHLPAAQQRALLLAQLGQLNRTQKVEQKQLAQLGSAGNTFGCLRKTWLVRQPPHFGNVRSLKH